MNMSMNKNFSLIISLFSIFLIGTSVAELDMQQSPFGGPELPSLNDAQLKEMQGLFDYLASLSPEELEKIEQEARNTLVDMGFNPDTFEPLEPTAPTAPTEPKAPVEAEKPAAPQPPPLPSEYNAQQTHAVLDRLVARISQLRQKASSHVLEHRQLASWQEELNDMIFYLRVIRKPVHYQRLTTQEFLPLMKALSQLADTLDIYEPQFVIEDVILAEDIDNPYDILGVSYQASQEELERAYQRLAQAQSPEHVQNYLSAQGVVGRDLEHALKNARLTFSIITNAYQMLKDPKARAQVDRELQALKASRQEVEAGAQKALRSILDALSTAIYNQHVVTDLEKFLKNYEPQELALRKELETAEKERLKEQQELFKLVPKPSPGGPYEQRPSRTTPELKPEFAGVPRFGPPPLTGGAGAAGGPGTPEEPKAPEKDGGSGKGGKGGKKKEDKDKKEEKDKQDKKGEGKDKKEEKDKKEKKEKKEEEAFDVLGMQIAQVDEMLFNIKHYLNKEFIDKIAQSPVNEQTMQELNLFAQTVNLPLMVNSLEHIYNQLKELKTDRKKKQYKELWQGIDKRYKDLKEHIVALHDLLTKKLENASSQPLPADKPEEKALREQNILQPLGFFTHYIEKLGTSIAQLNELFKAEEKKEQEHKPGTPLPRRTVGKK